MKLKITDWILTGDISPLKWGDSSIQIAEVFENSHDEIKDLKHRGFPYIVLDFVEFYFDKDNYKNLTEICIKNISIYKGLKLKFFDQEWLAQDITFSFVSKKMTELKVDWKIERGRYQQTPNILTSKGVLFGFELDKDDEKKSELIKIYIRK